MVISRPKGLARAPKESAEAQIGRLVGANERLQNEIAARLNLGTEWKADVLFRAMIDQVPDYLFIKDTQSRFVVANRAVAADLGARPEDLIGKTDFELHPSERAEKFYSDEQNVVRSGQPMIDIEEFIIDGNGNKKFLLTTKVPLRNDRDEVIGLVGIARDVTARKQAEDQVHFLAHHDPLTRLPNRSLLMDRLGQAIRHATRNDRWVSIAFVDLDNFKEINDSLGHSAGDELLKAVAARMVGCVRATDTVARLGGDEFVVVLVDQPESATTISSVVEKVRVTVAEPIRLDDRTLRVTCSIGLAIFPTEGTDSETLLSNADAAMYQAKAAGRDNLKLFAAGTKESPGRVERRRFPASKA
jgi:diguanylate cyclase (GGDEF)-like protein/PAS domain S-box-containing protein